jgi:hypothetical protein
MKSKKANTTPTPVCPICMEPCFMGYDGTPGNPVIIITDEPEIGEETPLSKAMEVLRSELAREGLDLYAFRYLPLHRHPMGTKSGKCKEEHAKWLFDEIRNFDIVFALGALCVKTLTGQNSSDVSGLKVESDLLSDTKILICCTSPASALQTCGELRFAVQTFAHEYSEYNRLWS